MLESASRPGPRTNPYISLLGQALGERVDLRWFSWRDAVLGRYDVLHLHWPEVKLRGRTRVRTWARWALFLLMLLRARLGRRAIVRTLHNAEPHEPLPWPASLLIRVCDRWTTWWIALSPLALPPTSAPVTTIPHGHYRDWFAHLSRAERVGGRVLHLGLLRPYKGIDQLLEAAAEVSREPFELRIVGRPVVEELARMVRRVAAADRRIVFVDRYVPDPELVREVTAAQIVVVPHAATNNSGTLLLALSLGRPVLVPDGAASEALAAEVGHAWVRTYRPPLTGPDLVRALRETQQPPEDPPDLTCREWPALAASHEKVLEAAVARARRRARGRRAVYDRRRTAPERGARTE